MHSIEEAREAALHGMPVLSVWEKAKIGEQGTYIGLLIGEERDMH